MQEVELDESILNRNLLSRIGAQLFDPQGRFLAIIVASAKTFMSRGCEVVKMDEKNALKKPFKMMDPEFSKLLLRFVRNLRTIDQLKSEDRCIVKHNQEIFGIVAPSDGGKTGAGSCAYILTEKIHHEPTVKDDERIMVDIPIATKLIESGKKISEKDWKGIIFQMRTQI